MASRSAEDAAPAATKRPGRYKHVLDALVGKFHGFPDGIFAQGTARVGEIRYVDLSERRVYNNGEITRDATGHARVERIERTETVPEWKAVPHLQFAIAITVTAKGRAHSYRDEPGSELRFFPDRA